eukprot:2330750-Pyramimonas_sp.AAC.1
MAGTRLPRAQTRPPLGQGHTPHTCKVPRTGGSYHNKTDTRFTSHVHCRGHYWAQEARLTRAKCRTWAERTTITLTHASHVHSRGHRWSLDTRPT